jgi:hypothetical protein
MLKYNKPHIDHYCWCNVCKNWLSQQADKAVNLARLNLPNSDPDSIEIEDEAVRILHESRRKYSEKIL